MTGTIIFLALIWGTSSDVLLRRKFRIALSHENSFCTAEHFNQHIENIWLLKALKRSGCKSNALAPQSYFQLCIGNQMIMNSSISSDARSKRPCWNRQTSPCWVISTAVFLWEMIWTVFCRRWVGTVKNYVQSLTCSICKTSYGRPRQQRYSHVLW